MEGSSIQNIHEFQEMATVGNDILETNVFFKDLVGLMKNVQFRNFYNEHFTDWSDIQVMVFYMKLYATIESEYAARYCREIDDNVIVCVMHNIMSTQITRKIALDIFKNYKEDVNMSVLRPLLEFTGEVVQKL